MSYTRYIRGQDSEKDKVVDALREYIPGFWPGCKLQVIKDGHNIPRGKCFDSSQNIDNLKGALTACKNNISSVNFGYSGGSIHYMHFVVKDPINYWKELNPFSANYRIKTEQEFIKEFGSLEYVSDLKVGMKHLFGMKITDKFAQEIVDRDGSSSDQDCFKDWITGKDYIWYISEEMITNKPLELVLGKFNIGQIVVSLTDCVGLRKAGELFKILPNSSKGALYYKESANSSSANDWRAATDEEMFLYDAGRRNISDSFLPTPLVFGKFKIGQILVSLDDYSGYREAGDLVEVVETSEPTVLHYRSNRYPETRRSSAEISFRAATDIETHYFKKGYISYKDIPDSSIVVDTTGSTSKDELLVFGMFKIGSIVVANLKKTVTDNRRDGEMFRVQLNSTEEYLHFNSRITNRIETCYTPGLWRLASPIEVKAYIDGAIISPYTTMNSTQKNTSNSFKIPKSSSKILDTTCEYLPDIKTEFKRKTKSKYLKL